VTSDSVPESVVACYRARNKNLSLVLSFDTRSINVVGRCVEY
jgi:hypothetical protein